MYRAGKVSNAFFTILLSQGITIKDAGNLKPFMPTSSV